MYVQVCGCCHIPSPPPWALGGRYGKEPQTSYQSMLRLIGGLERESSLVSNHVSKKVSAAPAPAPARMRACHDAHRSDTACAGWQMCVRLRTGATFPSHPADAQLTGLDWERAMRIPKEPAADWRDLPNVEVRRAPRLHRPPPSHRISAFIAVCHAPLRLWCR